MKVVIVHLIIFAFRNPLGKSRFFPNSYVDKNFGELQTVQRPSSLKMSREIWDRLQNRMPWLWRWQWRVNAEKRSKKHVSLLRSSWSHVFGHPYCCLSGWCSRIPKKLWISGVKSWPYTYCLLRTSSRISQHGHRLNCYSHRPEIYRPKFATMLQRIVFVFLMAPWVLEISSFSPLTRSAFRIKSALKVAYNTFVTVDSTFETPCSLIADEGVSLSDYMKLPVDQYVCIKMPLDATLERIDGAKFNMTVPPVRFFTLDVSPTIICDVGQSNEFVTIESSDCTLRGSPYVEALNGCYRLKISSTFTWFDR